MENKKVYIITGYAASGKTTLVNKLKNDGWIVISAGEEFTNIALQNGIKKSRHLIQNFSIKYFRTNGFKPFADILIKKAKNHSKIIFEGVRPIEVVHEIKREFPTTKIIFLDADISLRKKRILLRSKFSSMKVAQLQKHMIEKNLVFIKREADYIITNNNDIESFVNEVKNILKD